MQVHGMFVKFGGNSLYLYINNVLVDGYSKCRHLKDAESVLKTMEDTYMVSWTALTE